MIPYLQLYRYAKSYKLSIIFAAMFSSLYQIFDILPDLLLGFAIDVVTYREQSYLASLGIKDTVWQLITLVIITLIVYFLESFFYFCYTYFWKNTVQGILHKLRLDVYQQLQKLDMNFFEEKASGNLQTILVDDINLLDNFLSEGLAEIIQLITSSLFITGIFLYLSGTIALFALLPLPLIILTALYFQKPLKNSYAKVREFAGKLASHINNNIISIATIKSCSTECYEQEKVTDLSNKYLQANTEAIKYSSVFLPLVNLLILIGYATTLLIGGLFTIKNKLTVGGFSVFIFLSQKLLWPFYNLAWRLDIYEKTTASVNRIFTLLKTNFNTKDGDQIFLTKTTNFPIIFNNVVFDYPNGKKVFDDLSFEIPRGKRIAFVGSSGSGKSTIIKLILRFYDPIKGQILFNGQPLTDYTLNSIRNSIGFVGQNIFLTSGTIKENIAYGISNSSFEDIVKAAKMAQAYDFIMDLPNQFDTIVGERGFKLSQGQCQRICIARVILKNPQIIIFDEATSAVDNETEQALENAISKLTKNQTIIIIAHRLSTIYNADRIYVFDKGQIIESGVHDELLNKAGYYSKLWQFQIRQPVIHTL